MRALITGAGHGGIGGATCVRLARDAQAKGESTKLVLCSTGKRGALATLVDELRDLGAETLQLTGDLRDPAVPARLVDEAVAFCGGLDAVVANAGVGKPGALASLAEEDWDFAFSLNVKASWLLAKAAYPALRDSRGALVVTASMAGTAPAPESGAYPIAKAALIMLARTLAQEWARDGIRVNAVSPGPIRSRLTARYYADPAVEASRKAAIPLGRIGEPEDVAGAIAFLLGPDAAFVTGENLLIDGGLVGASLRRLAEVKATPVTAAKGV